MKKGYFSAMLVAAVLFVLTIMFMGPLTYNVVNYFWLKPGLTEAIGSSYSDETSRGVIFQRKAMESPDIFPVFGSSELSAVSEFHPSKLFLGKPSGFSPFIIGHGGCQDLIHALSIAAQGDEIRGKKVTIILSAQWFKPEGLTDEYFNQNFSAVQTYRLMYNPAIKAETKKKLAARIVQYPMVSSDYPILARLLANYGGSDWKSQFKQAIYMTLGRVELAGLEVRDAVQTVQLIRKVDPRGLPKVTANPKPIAPTAWQSHYAMAEKVGKDSTDTNQFGVLNPYYKQYVQPTLSQKIGSAKLETTYPSREYQDFELLLQVLEQQDVKPLFIVVPVNGRWYDYTGFPKGERDSYYKRVEEIIRNKGFSVANFGGKEYELYFLQDIMHVGWKGWVYIDEAMDHFYHSAK